MAAGVPALLLAGFAQSLVMIPMTSTLLQASGDRFRARVMGVRTLAVYGMPLGLLGSGFLIERVGFPLTVSISCALGILCTLLIAVRWRGPLVRGVVSL